jgi:hypothetical protein
MAASGRNKLRIARCSSSGAQSTATKVSLSAVKLVKELAVHSVMRLEPDILPRDQALSAIRSKRNEHWKHVLGFVAVNCFNGVLFIVTWQSYWQRTTLSMLGLAIAIFWFCVNRPPPKHAYVEAQEIVFGLGLFREWMLLVLAIVASLFVSLGSASIWLYCICKYLVPSSISSIKYFSIFVVGVASFGLVSRVYRRAWAAECSLLLECDHVLRSVWLEPKSKGKVYEITCKQCRSFYYTPEPLFTRGLCKQCYGVERFIAHWWMGAAAFSILVWQIALRQLAIHLVSGSLARWALWASLFLISGVVWYPLVRGRWHVLFYWPRHRVESADSDSTDVPPPRLIADSSWTGQDFAEKFGKDP